MSFLNKKNLVVQDLGFGDCGKGTIVSYLASIHKPDNIVRYNGGAQAAHNVIENGVHHCFHSYGSATMQGIPTAYLPPVLIDPVMIIQECRELREKEITPSPIKISSSNLIVTTYHKLVNRFMEQLREDNRHGSCGMGIGATVQAKKESYMVPKVASCLLDTSWRRWTLFEVRHWAEQKILQYKKINLKLVDEYMNLLWDREEFDAHLDLFAKLVDKNFIECTNLFGVLNGKCIFEGAQGTLLDEEFGLLPHNTWSKCTGQSITEQMTVSEWCNDTVVIGVIRGYQTRHGHGPFPTEDSSLDYAKGDRNQVNEWQGNFRTGHLDLALTKYAIECNPRVDYLAVTCLDQLPDTIYYRPPLSMMVTEKFVDYKHRVFTKENPQLIQIPKSELIYVIEKELSIPVVITSHGPDIKDKVIIDV